MMKSSKAAMFGAAVLGAAIVQGSTADARSDIEPIAGVHVIFPKLVPQVEVLPPFPWVPAPVRVKGDTLGQAQYSGGHFRSMGYGEWRHYDAQGRMTTVLNEKGRDEWSVYLETSLGTDVQLDAWQKTVIVNGQTFTMTSAPASN